MIIKQMQRKLATWTATAPDRRVNRLLRIISHPQWLKEATRITLSSKGARTPGVDGVTKVRLSGDQEDYLKGLSFNAKKSPLKDRIANNQQNDNLVWECNFFCVNALFKL